MNLVRKYFYLLLFLLLAWLAVLPYWPTIQEEAAHLHTVWQQTRHADPPRTHAAEAPEPEQEQEHQRERRIAAPSAAELVAPVVEPVPDPDLPDPLLQEARRRAQADPEAAMQWLQEQGSGAERLRGMLEVVALWAAEDSESALLWLESNAQGLARLESLNSGIELWAERNPKAAAEWVDGMANDGSKTAAAKSLAKSWGTRAPDEAAAWVAGLPAGEIRAAAAMSLVESWAGQDPWVASAWALQLADSTGDERPLQESLRQYALENPAGAEAFARQMAQAADSSSGILAYIRARADIDPAETADWLASLPPEDPIHQSRNFDRYTQAAIAAWTENDSIAASAWLSEQASGSNRDAAILGFAESIQRFEPEAATAWANTLSDPQLREQQVARSVLAWAERDPRSALEWVIDAELEPDLEEALAREIGIE